MSNITSDALEAPSYELTALDRCGSCGAQAYIRVELGSGELLFCAHHGKKYQEKLSSLARTWPDDSRPLPQGSKSCPVSLRFPSTRPHRGRPDPVNLSVRIAG